MAQRRYGSYSQRPRPFHNLYDEHPQQHPASAGYQIPTNPYPPAPTQFSHSTPQYQGPLPRYAYARHAAQPMNNQYQGQHVQQTADPSARPYTRYSSHYTPQFARQQAKQSTGPPPPSEFTRQPSQRVSQSMGPPPPSQFTRQLSQQTTGQPPAYLYTRYPRRHTLQFARQRVSHSMGPPPLNKFTSQPLQQTTGPLLDRLYTTPQFARQQASQSMGPPPISEFTSQPSQRALSSQATPDRFWDAGYEPTADNKYAQQLADHPELSKEVMDEFWDPAPQHNRCAFFTEPQSSRHRLGHQIPTAQPTRAPQTRAFCRACYGTGYERPPPRWSSSAHPQQNRFATPPTASRRDFVPTPSYQAEPQTYSAASFHQVPPSYWGPPEKPESSPQYAQQSSHAAPAPENTDHQDQYFVDVALPHGMDRTDELKDDDDGAGYDGPVGCQLAPPQ